LPPFVLVAQPIADEPPSKMRPTSKAETIEIGRASCRERV